ncbi:MAG: hypothetical protein VYA11_04050 [Planctomycetota bacterium]|nr:hypothetical protein [Planctomycetota bacterium]
MAKAPAILKWFFAIIAFAAGSIVAQLLQPPTAKTDGIGGVTLVAQLEAAPTELASAVDPVVITLSPPSSSRPTVATSVPTIGVAKPLKNVTASKVTNVSPPPVSRVEMPRANPNLSKSDVPDGGKIAAKQNAKQNVSKPLINAAEPTPITHQSPSVTSPSEKPAQISVSRPRPELQERSLHKQLDPHRVQAETLSLTRLPTLSSEANDFHKIRHSLPGQFEPLKGVPQLKHASEIKKVVVAKQPKIAFSSTTTLPTEMVPAAKLNPTTGVVVAPESQALGTQIAKKQNTSDDTLTAASSVETVVVTPPASVPPHSTPVNNPRKAAPQKIAKAPIAIAQKTKQPTANKTESLAVTQKSQPLSPELIALRSKLGRVIKMYREQEISVREKSAWSVMHSFIGYGVEKKVRIDHQGNRASAIGWICFNNPCRGVRLFYLKNGEIYGRLGPGNQGHEGQFLAMLAQSRVHADYPMKVEGRDFTVLDLVEREKRSCRPKTELTFKLIGLSHYLESDETWKDDRGSDWNIPRLLKEEMQQPIIGAACGGTHRLFGLSYAINRRIHKGKPVDGQYRRAEVYIKDYQKYTFKMQNPDGSFSTRFFSGRGAANDLDRRLLTTGHISEWLAFSLSKKELTDPRMVHAMDYLAGLLLRGKYPGWKVGPLGHALHAVNIYNDRVFKDTVSTPVVATRSR